VPDPLQIGGLGISLTATTVAGTVGLVGLVLVVYWTIQAIDESNDASEVADEVSGNARGLIVAIVAVAVTVGNQLLQLGADIAGMIESPLAVGHFIGGVLGWLGISGRITLGEFVALFGIVTALALIWRANSTRGAGL
jgi:hypothetical protein